MFFFFLAKYTLANDIKKTKTSYHGENDNSIILKKKKHHTKISGLFERLISAVSYRLPESNEKRVCVVDYYKFTVFNVYCFQIVEKLTHSEKPPLVIPFNDFFIFNLEKKRLVSFNL